MNLQAPKLANEYPKRDWKCSLGSPSSPTPSTMETDEEPRKTQRYFILVIGCIVIELQCCGFFKIKFAQNCNCYNDNLLDFKLHGSPECQS